MSARLKIAALGSSFAAGPSIRPIVDQAARRSGRNYAHQLAERLDAQLTDLTSSGATLLNVLDEPQAILGSQDSFPPQLDALPTDADIVTITAGGNDLGYSWAMIKDSMQARLWPVWWILEWWLKSPSAAIDGAELVRRYLAVIDRIHEKAPNSNIYLVQYLAVFGDESRPGVENALNAAQIQGYREQAEILVRATENVSEARPEIRLVRAAKDSEEHAVGSLTPWVSGFSLSMLLQRQTPYHPNLAGHVAIADMLYQSISRSMASEEP